MPNTPDKSIAAILAAIGKRGHPRNTPPPAAAAPSARARGRPRKKPPLPPRFAPIRLDTLPGARIDAIPLAAAFEVGFPGGLTLRATRDADPAVMNGLVALLLSRREG